MITRDARSPGQLASIVERAYDQDAHARGESLCTAKSFFLDNDECICPK